MAQCNHKGRNCLSLGASPIGLMTRSLIGKVIDDDAKKILGGCAETKFMINEIEKHLLEVYPSVFDGTLSEIKSFPQLFNYGIGTKKESKALAMQYGNEKEIEARIKVLEGSKKMEDVKERMQLTEILKEKRPLSCEYKVNKRFLNFFKNEPGLFLHGFKPKEYLQGFRELAKEIRKTTSTLKLLDIENCVLDLLGIQEKEIENWVIEKLDRIKIKKGQSTAQSPGSTFSGALIWDALQLNSLNSFPKERQNQFNQLRSTFPKFKNLMVNGKQKDVLDVNGLKIEETYTLNEIRTRLLESEFDFKTNFDDEYDLFLFLPNEKLILAGEAKQAMQNDPKAIIANDKQAKSASKQLKKSKQFMKQTFGHLLDQGWMFVKIAILFDNNGMYATDRCPGCKPFILTNGTKGEEVKQMQDLWKALTGREYIGPPKSPNATGMEGFKSIFARLIGFSGLSFIVQKLGHYHELMGTNSHDIFCDGITAGWTRASPLRFSAEKSNIRFGDVVGRPSDIYRLIFWNPEQRDLLNGNHRFVIFCHDYGAGMCSKN